MHLFALSELTPRGQTEMELKNSRSLATSDQELEKTEGSDHELRYERDPVEALIECRDRFQVNETGYHEERRQLTATIYAIALRLLKDEDASDRFHAQDYFHRPWRRYVRTPRDLFREVFKFVTGEGNKTASKYSKVLWHLHEGNCDPEDAASVIDVAGGIEKMARCGIPQPTYIHPADVGDGMDGFGNKINYPDDPIADNDEDEYRPETEDDNSPESAPATFRAGNMSAMPVVDKTISVARIAAAPPSESSESRKNGQKTDALVIQSSPEHRAIIKSLRVGSEIMIHVKRLQSADGSPRIQITQILRRSNARTSSSWGHEKTLSVAAPGRLRFATAGEMTERARAKKISAIITEAK